MAETAPGPDTPKRPEEEQEVNTAGYAPPPLPPAAAEPPMATAPTSPAAEKPAAASGAVAGGPSTSGKVASAAPPVAKTPVEPEYGHLPLSEEMDKAKWTLPPIGIVLIGIAAVALVGFVLGWFNRYQPVVSGRVEQVFAVPTSDGSSVLAAVQITIKNEFKKPLYIHSLKGELKTGDGKSLVDEPANEVDYERYFQAFPDLRAHATAALKPEMKIEPGQQASGTLVFGFDVTKEQFDARKDLLITVEPYDNRAIVMSEKGGAK